MAQARRDGGDRMDAERWGFGEQCQKKKSAIESLNALLQGETSSRATRSPSFRYVNACEERC
jgi:hypothetical protein